MMRDKLKLTDKELMRMTWISLNLQMTDFPYYDHKGKKEDIYVTDKDEADAYLSKFKNRSKHK